MKQATLFDAQPTGPVEYSWRKPTHGEQPCDICGHAAGNGMGPPLMAKQVFYCMNCTPADFWPSRRAGGRNDF